MSSEWVTEPVLTSDTVPMPAASGVVMLSVPPGSVTVVALVMVGRAAAVPSLLNRYGG